MKRTLLLIALLPALASAQGIGGPVNTARISRNSPAHYVSFGLTTTPNTVASGTIAVFLYPYDAPGRLVDVIVYQVGAGTGGTSYTVDVKNAAGTSLLSTLPVATLASGNEKVTDARGSLSLPSGWTRPVIKTDTTPDVAKGQRVYVVTTETGTYSPHASVLVTLVFEPKQ